MSIWHTRSSDQDIKPDNKFVVYSGKEKFKTKDGVIVVSLPQMLEM